MGRATIYNKTKHPEIAEKFSKLGMTDKEMCKALDIGETTFYNWKKKYREFRESVEGHKHIIDAEIANALYERALGKTVTEKKIVKARKKDSKGVMRLIIVEEEVKEKTFLGSVEAQKFWLINRQADKFKLNPEAYDDEAPLPSRVEIGKVDARVRPKEEIDLDDE